MTLDEVGRFGPFFALDGHSVAEQGWIAVSELGVVPERLTYRIRMTRAALTRFAPGLLETDVPWRVAASVTQLGLSARLLAVALALTVDRALLPPKAALRYQDTLGGPFPLAVSDDQGAGRLGVSWPGVLLDWVGPLTNAAVVEHGLSARVAWGNVASALAGSTKMIMAADETAGARARELCEQALALPELSNTGSFDAGGVYRRRSCCLIYQLAAEPMFCADCVLATRTDKGVSST